MGGGGDIEVDNDREKGVCNGVDIAGKRVGIEAETGVFVRKKIFNLMYVKRALLNGQSRLKTHLLRHPLEHFAENGPNVFVDMFVLASVGGNVRQHLSVVGP